MGWKDALGRVQWRIYDNALKLVQSKNTPSSPWTYRHPRGWRSVEDGSMTLHVFSPSFVRVQRFRNGQEDGWCGSHLYTQTPLRLCLTFGLPGYSRDLFCNSNKKKFRYANCHQVILRQIFFIIIMKKTDNNPFLLRKYPSYLSFCTITFPPELLLSLILYTTAPDNVHVHDTHSLRDSW